MAEKVSMTFEEIFRQNEKRINYQMVKLSINDPNRDFTWMDCMRCGWLSRNTIQTKARLQPTSTTTIRNRLLDMVRAKTREGSNLQKINHHKVCEVDNGSSCKTLKLPIIDPAGILLSGMRLVK